MFLILITCNWQTWRSDNLHWNDNKGEMMYWNVEYLKREDCNFIAVDWEKLASAPNYLRAADSTSPVGELTGQLINFLVKQGSQLSQFHVIGFSLGAHVAGKTGATVDGVLPRVTGKTSNCSKQTTFARCNLCLFITTLAYQLLSQISAVTG